MKNMLLLAFMAIFYCYACDDKETFTPDIPGITIVGEDFLAGDSLMYDTVSRTSTLSLIVSGEWSAGIEEDIDWCGVIRSALPGINKIQVNVAANSGPDERTCHVLIDGGGQQKKITVYQIGSTPALKVAPAGFTDLPVDSTEIKFRVITNVKYRVSVEEGGEWIIPLEQDELDTISYRFKIKKNGTTTRNGKILVQQVNGELKHEVIVFQQAKESDYTPADASNAGDRTIQVDHATATGTDAQGNEIPDFWYGSAVIGRSFDGDPNTHYASKSADKFPVTLTYFFTQPSDVDYLTYLPRQDGNASSGFIGDCEVLYQLEGSEDFVKAGDYNFGQTANLYRLKLNETLRNVTAFRFKITSSNNGQVSCAEMSFYTKRVSAATELFTDETCSELKPGVTLQEIEALDDNTDGFLKKIARFMYENSYPMERIQTYQPYMTIETVCRRLKTSNYNRFENPTGIYFTSGEKAVVFVAETTASVMLRVVDWSKAGNEQKSLYTLLPGTNVLTIAQKGLGYIEYYTDDYETAPEVKIHIASGIVNGYFDLERGDQDAKYTALLNNAKSAECPNLDIRGKYVQLCFDKASLLDKNPDRGREMIQEYDHIIKMEQDVMGVDAYQLRTTNRMFARRSYSGAPNANGWGVSFPGVNVIPENIRKDSWEIAHEFGHINQVRPGLKWQGTTEVTNNIYSATVQYFYTPENLRLEQENIGDGEGGTAMVGNRFNCYFNNGIIKGQPWLFQKGQNNPNPETGAGDLFVRLCPFWQLQLYNKYTGLGVEDFYPRLIQIIRNTDETELTTKELQFNFMRNTCQVMQADMTQFFEKCGMLREVDRDVSDYGGTVRLTITQQDIETFKNEIKAENYPQPVSPVIYYISGNSVNVFKNRAAVEGTTGVGVTGSGSSRLVTAQAWKNVVVFETYAGNELVKLTLPFTNFKDKTATTVFYPDGATRIEAVSWDGSRTLVYGTR